MCFHAAINAQLTELKDKLEALEMEIIRNNASSEQKDPYSTIVDNLQSLVATLTTNLPNLDPLKAKEKADFIGQALAQFEIDWSDFKFEFATAVPTTTTTAATTTRKPLVYP
jgi:DNA repair exonuclease SbcCD ATPase subunit